MIPRVLLFLAALTVTSAANLQVDAGSAGAHSVVQLIVTHQDNDAVMPWQKSPPAVRVGYAVVIASNRLLTTENLIRQHRLLEMRRPRSGDKIPVRVIVADEQVNLALLEIQQPERSTGLVSIALADDVRRNSPTEILQMDETSQMQRGDGHILQIMMAPLPRAPYGSLAYTMLTDLNVNGEGAAILSSNRLAGLIMSYDRNSRVGWLIPYPVIARFLAMAETSPYKGFASAGFSWAALIDPVKRRYLGVEGTDVGIAVLAYTPAPGADTNAIQAGDVILEWDGYPIDNLGFYNDEVLGRMDLSWLIKGHRNPGDTVNVKIIRHRTEQTVPLTLRHRLDSENLIPDDTTGQPAEYLLHGGFLIRELSGRYLQANGADWRRNADTRLVSLYLTRRMTPDFAGQRIVILSTVIPDPINVGYQHLHDQVITHVNGQPVSSMKDVFRLHDADGGIRRITIQSSGVDVVIDPNTVEAANRRLLTSYGIPKWRHMRADVGLTSRASGTHQ